MEGAGKTERLATYSIFKAAHYHPDKSSFYDPEGTINFTRAS